MWTRHREPCYACGHSWAEHRTRADLGTERTRGCKRCACAAYDNEGQVQADLAAVEALGAPRWPEKDYERRFAPTIQGLEDMVAYCAPNSQPVLADVGPGQVRLRVARKLTNWERLQIHQGWRKWAPVAVCLERIDEP